MAKVVSDFLMLHPHVSPDTPLSEVSKFAHEIGKKLKDRRDCSNARDRLLRSGYSKEWATCLIPFQPSGKRVKNRDPIKVIALRIVRDNLEPEEINKIAFDLAMSATSFCINNWILRM
jgi:hypothetical protein